MAKLKALCVAALAWMGLMAASARQASLIGEFTQFQYCPFNNPEVESLLEATVTDRVSNDRRGLENSFLGLTCYVGSVVQTARQIVTLKNPNRTDCRQSKFFGSSQPNTARLTAGNEQFGTEQTTTGMHAFRTLTLSPA
jgi:hypothetical protein